MMLVGPYLNLNGTSRDELVGQYRKALEALTEAQQCLRVMSPHGRDYQTAPDGQYKLARDQHEDRCNRLAAIQNEVATLAENFVTKYA